MTANHDLRRRVARYYETEPPLRAPDWVLQSALSTVESTPQRRGLPALRRNPFMPTFTKLAAAAVVLAVGGYTLWSLAGSGVGGPPVPSATPTVTQSPTPRPSETPWSAYIPPELTGTTFTSAVHGLSIAAPDGWVQLAATAPWTTSGPPMFREPTGDFLYDPGRTDHLFVGLASQPLGETSFEDWSSALLAMFARDGCTGTEPIVVDGYDGLLGTTCSFAWVSAGDRGYLTVLYRSRDDLDLQTWEWKSWLVALLETMQLQPEVAIDE
jgi:hypothetical protein